MPAGPTGPAQRSTGANSVWLSANSATQKGVCAMPAAWFLAAVADYNHDGQVDLLWRNLATGANLIWRSADYLQPQSVTTATPRWTVVR